MATISISEIKNLSPHKPCDGKQLKAVVAAIGHTASFTTTEGEKFILNFSLTDTTDVIMATLTEEEYFPLIKEGNTLHMRNFIFKDNKIALHKKSKIRQGCKLEVGEGLMQRARNLITPPSPLKRVEAVKTSPSKSICTIQGTVVKDEVPRTVLVRSTETPIRTITIDDEGHTIDVTLWRELAQSAIKVGDIVELTSCQTNLFRQNMTLNSTRNTSIKVIDVPVKEKEGQIQSIFFKDCTSEVEILVGNSFLDFDIDNSILESLFEMHIALIKDNLNSLLPKMVKMSVKGNTIISAKLSTE